MLAGVLATTTMGMGVSASDDDYDFYFFNIKGEDADAMQAAVDAYKGGNRSNHKNCLLLVPVLTVPRL